MDQISKLIAPATQNDAEYQGLIEGLKLAGKHRVQRLRVYMDSDLVVNQVNGIWEVDEPRLKELREDASSLVDGFKDVRICWVPREWNAEADQLVNDALRTPD